ncbi:hypothetical protein [Sulfurimonas sp.]
MKIILFLVLSLNLFASDTFSVRIAHGNASENDLGQIISGDIGSHPRDLTVSAVDGGYILKNNLWDLPIDMYLKSGLAYFNEDHFSNTYEVTLYIKLYYNFDFLKNRVRFGFGEGGSYTHKILETEYLEAQSKADNNSYYLNYLDISLDFDFGRFIHYKPLYGTYGGILLKHRSGIYGLINNVKNGGSNYNCLYIEKNF